MNMKTKEEIEQLAKQSNDERGIDSAKSMLEREYVLGYTNAYTQCQEDMADKIEQAIEYGYQLRCNHKPINSGIDWVKEFNLLNKQD